MNGFNPMQLMQMMRGGGNPSVFIDNVIQGNPQIANNPILKNAIKAYKDGNAAELNKIVENMCKERGTSIEEVKSKIFNN